MEIVNDHEQYESKMIEQNPSPKPYKGETLEHCPRAKLCGKQCAAFTQTHRTHDFHAGGRHIKAPDQQLRWLALTGHVKPYRAQHPPW